jgi:hypothetical protein
MVNALIGGSTAVSMSLACGDAPRCCGASFPDNTILRRVLKANLHDDCVQPKEHFTGGPLSRGGDLGNTGLAKGTQPSQIGK